jgi:DNA-binding FrmR family transcriptional regulator
LEQFGDEEEELATRLRQIRGQIEAKITILRA